MKQWQVVHGKDGYEAHLYNMSVLYMTVEFATETVLGALGHPCCGRGLGRIDAVAVLAYRLLNVPCKLWRLNKKMTTFPISDELALELAPSFVARMNELEDDD